MIKNNNYYCLKKQEFIKKYQLFVLEKIKNWQKKKEKIL